MAAAALKPHLLKIKVPLGGEKVYKDECTYSFDNPESPDGLYVCMNQFIGLGKKYVELYSKKTGNSVFLNIKRRRQELPKAEEPKEKKPTKLAIGVEGGFQVDDKKFEFVEDNSIVVLPAWTNIKLNDAEIPDMVQLSVKCILAAEDAWKAEEAAALAGTWEGEQKQVSRHAAKLVQLNNGKKIPPKGWKCEKCDLTTNLWLNLTDGSILCGRRFFDGKGGNNHAVDHYGKMKYPLAVKLGTITPDGADVYSYDEDDMVLDPYLDKHLAHFGINITSLEKTDKTMVELEIDLNQKIAEWDVIQEAGSKLEPVYGSGYTGIRNLGNSCYMNSVMQTIFTIPDFQMKYLQNREEIFNSCSPLDVISNFDAQMAKFGHGLLSGDYSKPPIEGVDAILQPPNGIRPQMFKLLIGKGHPEFSTKRQQDAQEFFLHLVNLIERNSRGSFNPADCFRFQVEDRVKCSQSGQVKYIHREDFLLALPVLVEETAVNQEEVLAYEAKKKELESQGLKIDPKEVVRPKIPLTACVEGFAATENVDDFYSTAVNAKTVAHKTTRFATFPDYLMVQLKKFKIGEDWMPKKLDVSVDVPEELDLSAFRAKGLQPWEDELPAEKSAQPQIDENIVSQLVSMGFDLNGCMKAAFYTQNSGVEAAMNWVMDHMNDSDFSAPFAPPDTNKLNMSFIPDEEALAMVMSMGFTVDQATKALKATENNTERAIDWIFSHQDELDTPMETDENNSKSSESKFRDGPGRYKLVGFISHMGTSTMVGHYVCHLLKNNRWIIFNDEKVAYSEQPPKDLAYMYLYKRI
ncbi:hypothetical protein ACJMK2_007461 [Sinanodonta woodiana]|uniref:Ubiquitin carboxyl-terminal hydrolase n=1 Tax=Sinanodonta woodiana TaxID=1069815 RepID=A0ABD3VLM0_SINWO